MPRRKPAQRSSYGQVSVTQLVFCSKREYSRSDLHEKRTLASLILVQGKECRPFSTRPTENLHCHCILAGTHGCGDQRQQHTSSTNDESRENDPILEDERLDEMGQSRERKEDDEGDTDPRMRLVAVLLFIGDIGGIAHGCLYLQ